jgi:hypothetical protein
MKRDPDRDDQLAARLRAYAERLDARSAADAGPLVAAPGRAPADGRRRAWLAGTAVAAALAGAAALAWLADGDDGRPSPDGVVAVSPAAVSPADVSPADASTVPGLPTTVTESTTRWPTVVVPAFVGRDAPGATVAVDALGLRAVVEPEASATAPPGTVVRTTPEAATEVVPGSLVRLAVSTGPEGSGLMIDAVGHVVRNLLPTDQVPAVPLPGGLSDRATDDRYLGRLAGTDVLVRRAEVPDPATQAVSTCVFFESASAPDGGASLGGGCSTDTEARGFTNQDGGGAIGLIPADGAVMVGLEDGTRAELTHPVDGLAVVLAATAPSDDHPVTLCWFDASGNAVSTERYPSG